MVKRYSKVKIHDSNDKHGMFDKGEEQVEAMTVDWNVNREDRGDFYYRWRRRGNYW